MFTDYTKIIVKAGDGGCEITGRRRQRMYNGFAV